MSTPPETRVTFTPTVAQAARWLTAIGTTPDGGIVVGPEGWHALQLALGADSRALVTPLVMAEVQAAADDFARRGLDGAPGNLLPDLMSGGACGWINGHIADFQAMVRTASESRS